MCDFQPGVAWNRRQTVLSDANPHHFTLPAIETANKDVAGYIHCTYAEDSKVSVRWWLEHGRLFTFGSCKNFGS